MRGILRFAGIFLFATAIPQSLSRGQAESGAWGGLTELSRWEPSSINLVKNPSFEELDESGNPVGWTKTAGSFRAVRGVGRDGGTGVRLKDSHRERRYSYLIQNIELDPGLYKVSGWVKSHEAGTNRKRAGGTIQVRGPHGRSSTPLVNGTTDWKRVEREKFVFPGGTAEVRLAGYRKPDGEVLFDDVELRRLDPPVVEGFLLHPNYRGILFPDRPQLVQLAVEVRPEEVGLSLPDVRVNVTLVPEGGSSAALRKSIDPDGQELTVELDATPLPPGPYMLQLEAVRRKSGEGISSYPSYRIFKLSSADRERFRTYIDEDDVLVLDGERTFALGIYNTGGYSARPGAYSRLVSKLSESPLNLYLNYWLGGAPDEAIAALLEALSGGGIHYLHTVNAWYETDKRWSKLPACPGGQRATELGEIAYTGCRARALGSLRGLAGWYTADERPASAVAGVFEQYRALRENDADGITFIAQNRMDEIGVWRDATDVVGVDPYPIFNIPEGQFSPLEMVLDWTERARDAVHGRRPVWTVIQYFKFGSKGHWPTYEELRTMSYMAIVGGAKGLFYWSYGAKGLAWVKNPARKEEIWGRLVRVTKEIEALEPVLLEADAPELLEIPPDPNEVRVLAKVHDGERFIIAVNRTSREVRAQFGLSAPAESVTALGENGESRSIALESPRMFRDSLGPYAARVYRIPAGTGE